MTNKNWISARFKKPAQLNEKGLRNLVWLFSVQRNTISMGYVNQHGSFDMDGTGFSYSYWMEIEKPEIPNFLKSE